MKEKRRHFRWTLWISVSCCQDAEVCATIRWSSVAIASVANLYRVCSRRTEGRSWVKIGRLKSTSSLCSFSCASYSSSSSLPSCLPSATAFRKLKCSDDATDVTFLIWQFAQCAFSWRWKKVSWSWKKWLYEKWSDVCVMAQRDSFCLLIFVNFVLLGWNIFLWNRLLILS